jgi:hypothetical protein
MYILIEEIDDLPFALDRMMNTNSVYRPLKFILATLSPKICMKRILDYFELDTKE